MNIVCEFSQPFVNSGHKSLINSSPRSRFRITQRKFNAGFSKGRVKSCSPLFRIRAAATIEAPEIKADSDVDTTVDLLACPICYKPLIRKGPSGLNLSAISGSGFQCKKCRKAYSSRDVYLDLTITGGSSEYYEYKPITTEMFRSPIVSFVYERGWRQRFATSGFPGPDEEFKMAQKYLEPVAGGLLVDASCGSGLFSRRFAKCGIYSGVVALDFSENMLRQCYEFIKGDKDLFTRNIALVRADISRLPFATGSVDAVHAGAALHCWPSPSTADKYFFTVGYHELEGRKVPLKKPLLVLRKNRLPDMMDVDSQINIPEAKSSRVELEVVGIIRQKFLFKTRPKALISKTEVKEKKIATLDASAS